EALSGIEWYQGDFSDPASLAGAIETYEIVYHLVHTTTPYSANLDMVKDLQQNVAASLALFDVSCALEVKRVVFVSTGGTVLGFTDEIPPPETAPTHQITAYGISKLAIEKYLALYERSYGLQYRILRVANPFGPFQVPIKNQGIIAMLISRGLKCETIDIWGDGSVVRDYIFIDDVIDALEAAMVDQSAARIFNIGSGQGRTLLEIIDAVERVMKMKLAIAWKRERSVDVPKSVLAIDEAREILKWVPRTPFDSALEKTLDWWKSRRQ